MTLSIRKKLNLTFTMQKLPQETHTHIHTYMHTYIYAAKPQNTRKTIRCSGNANNVSKFNYIYTYKFKTREKKSNANNQKQFEEINKCYGFVVVCRWALLSSHAKFKFKMKIRVFKYFFCALFQRRVEKNYCTNYSPNEILSLKWNLSKIGKEIGRVAQTTNWNTEINRCDLFFCFFFFFEKKSQLYLFGCDSREKIDPTFCVLFRPTRWDNCQIHYCFKMNRTLTKMPMQIAVYSI